MIRYIKLATFFCLLCFTGTSQRDTAAHPAPDIFDRIARGVKEFQLDTSAAPDDKITRKIVELRNLRGGFNVNEAVAFKMEEERQKNEMPKEEWEKLSVFFSAGDVKLCLVYSVIWIYLKHFSYGELKRLVKFYRTSAGQKMANDFPLLMIQSLRAAEMIRDFYVRNAKNR